jgi:hypothetical protein
MKFVVIRELGTVVKGNCLAPRWWQRRQDGLDGFGNGFGGFAARSKRNEQTGVSFVQGEDGLAIHCEQHQVSRPVRRCLTVSGLLGPFAQRTPVSNERGRAPTSATTPTAFGLAPWQILMPRVVLGAGDLYISLSHNNTLIRCCTSFVKLVNPVFCRAGLPGTCLFAAENSVLSQQQHLLRFNEVLGFDPVKVNARRYERPAVIGAVPGYGFFAC